MAKLKHSQMRALDEIFGMQGGYVLDFSNSTMARFFSDEFQVDIYVNKIVIYAKWYLFKMMIFNND